MLNSSVYLFFLTLAFDYLFFNLLLSPEHMPGLGLRYSFVTSVLCPYFIIRGTSKVHIGYNTQSSQHMKLNPARLQPPPVYWLALASIFFTAQSARSS